MSAERELYEPPEFLPMEAVDDDGIWRQREARRERTYHLAMFGLSALVLLTAALLRVRSDQRVEFAFAPDRPWPELCRMKVVYGIPCPGCGLTRCFVHAVHGDWGAAQGANAAGLLLVLLTAAQLPYRLWLVAHPEAMRWSALGVVMVLAIAPTALLLQWVLRLLVL